MNGYLCVFFSICINFAQWKKFHINKKEKIEINYKILSESFTTLTKMSQIIPILTLILFSEVIRSSNGIQTLEFLLATADQPGDGALIEDKETPTLPAFMKRAEKLCVNGL